MLNLRLIFAYHDKLAPNSRKQVAFLFETSLLIGLQISVQFYPPPPPKKTKQNKKQVIIIFCLWHAQFDIGQSLQLQYNTWSPSFKSPDNLPGPIGIFLNVFFVANYRHVTFKAKKN